jgi:hypothetical protein
MPLYNQYDCAANERSLGVGSYQYVGENRTRKSRSPTVKVRVAIPRAVCRRSIRNQKSSTSIMKRTRYTRGMLGLVLPSQDETEPAITRQQSTRVRSRTSRNGRKDVKTFNSGPGDCLTPREIMTYYTGELKGRVRAKARKHLSVCMFCNTQLSALQNAIKESFLNRKDS